MNKTISRTGVAAVLGGGLLLGSAGVASAETPVNEPATFTSAFTVMATPNNIINPEGASVAGQQGASGTFNFRINSDQEIICYDITLTNVTQPYQSPAKTATHIHEASAGTSGPPRIAFPNPQGEGTATSSGCLQGPFTTGVLANGVDTGDGFSLKGIESNPAGFFADTHTAANAAGAVRGQLNAMPVGGVATGAGGTSGSDEGSNAPLLAATLVALVGAGVVTARRQRVEV